MKVRPPKTDRTQLPAHASLPPAISLCVLVIREVPTTNHSEMVALAIEYVGQILGHQPSVCQAGTNSQTHLLNEV